MDSIDGRRRLKWLVVPLVFAAAVGAISIAVLAYYGAAPPSYYAWWPWAPFGWFLFVPLVFVGFFALRLFWWGRWAGPGWYYREDTAMQVLRERFARGELTKEQFEEMRRDLARS
jgi:putative membrane protein